MIMSQWSNSWKWWKSYRAPAKPNKVNGCVIIADIGATTSKVTAGGMTLSEKSKQCISYALQHKIFLEEKDDIGLVLCGSETTENQLFKETKSSYKHINVLANMKTVDWDLIKSIEKEMAKPTSFKGDWMDALGVALDLIENRCEAGVIYEEVRILVLVDFDQPVHTSVLTEEAYITTLKEKEMFLFFFNDEEFIKSEAKIPSQTVAQRLVSQLKGRGACIPFNELYSSAIVFSKSPKLGAAWNSILDIGTEIKIPVTGYIKVKQGESIKWKDETSDENIVDSERRFQTGSGETSADIDSQDLISAYKYGPEYIPLEIIKDKSTSRCLSVLGFVDPVPCHFFIGNGTTYFFARKADKSQKNIKCEQIALSAFIHAMYELGKVALVRRVYNNGSKPVIGILSPRIKVDYECLVYNEVPFADDYRKLYFSPIVNSKNQPTEEQLNSMDELIDNFSLLQTDKQTGELYEELKPNEVVDLHEEYIRHSVAFKILHPGEPLPEILPHIKSNMEPLPSVLIGSKELLERIKALFPLKVLDHLRVNGSEAVKRALVPAAAIPNEELGNPSKKLRLTDSEGVTSISTLLGDQNVHKIGTTNPVQDYLTLRKTKSADEVNREMEKVIISLLHDSSGTNTTLMSRVGDCIKVYRHSASAPDFNRFMKNFKQIVIDHQFETFWKDQIVGQQLGLNQVRADEAQEFLSLIPVSDGIDMTALEDDHLANLI